MKAENQNTSSCHVTKMQHQIII